MVSIKCAHGETVLYPLAVVDMEVEGIPVHVSKRASYEFLRKCHGGND